MLQEEGPWEDWRIVNTKIGLRYAARVVKNKGCEVDWLKIELAMGEHDGNHIFKNMGSLLEAFFHAMGNNTSVTKLALGDCALNDKIMEKYIVPMLKSNRKIIHLDLSRNNLTSVGVGYLFEALSSQGRSDHPIPFIDLGSNLRIQKGAAEELTKHNFTFCDVKKFSLAHCKDFGAPGMSSLLEHAPAGLKVLTDLNLMGVNLGDDGIVKLAELLSKTCMKMLRILNVTDCGIREVGVRELCKALEDFPLERLDLTKNHVGDGGLPFVLKMIKNNATLKNLQMKLCEFSRVKFMDFIKALTVAYDTMGTPMLEELNISKNGLGDEPVKWLKGLLLHRRCLITTINYDGNEMTDVGALSWAELLKEQVLHLDPKNESKRRNRKHHGEDIDVIKASDRALSGLTKLTLKDNKMTDVGIEYFANVLVVGARKLQHLDIRKNKIGLKGARHLKRALLGDQRHRDQIDFVAKHQFVLAVYPADVGGPAGINEIMVGMRTAGYLHRLSRYAMHSWLELNNGYDKDKFDEARTFLDQEEEDIKHTWDTDPGYVGAYLVAFKRIYVPVSHMPFIMTGWGERKNMDNQLAGLYDCVFVRNYKDEVIWNPLIWDSVKEGYVAHVAEALYRVALYLRLLEPKGSMFRDICAADIKRVMGTKTLTAGLGHQSLMLAFWEKVIKQKSPESEGLTMLEYCLKYGKGTLVDTLRQFAFIYPSLATSNTIGGFTHHFPPFAFAKLGHGSSGTTVQKACMECSDPAVRRWGGEKRLIQNRFAILEYVHKSKTYIIAKVEDLFNTEDEPKDRVFYVKEYVPKNKEAEKQAKNEGAAYAMLEISLEKRFEKGATPAELLSERDLETGEFLEANAKRVEEMVLFRENTIRNVIPFRATIPALPPPQSNARVIIYKPYVKTLRQALDDEGIAGCLDLEEKHMGRLRHVAMNIAEGLTALNNPAVWMNRLTDEELSNFTEEQLDGYKRMHGNLKPRNVVLKDLGDVGDAKGSENTEKWVLMDFSRSTEHDNLVDFSLYDHSAYMPPEIARRVLTYDSNVSQNLPANEKIDSWGFGCILYEMLSGVPLFQAEQREDWLLDKHERAELCNWVRLDEERIAMILPRVTEKDLAVQEMEKEKVEEWVEMKKLAINLVSWCLNGDPAQRPTVTEIRDHPFNKFKFKQKQATIKSETIRNLLAPMKVEGKDKAIVPHSHVHIANCNFLEAGSFVRTFEEYLHGVGCRLTTDMVGVGNDKDKVKENCKNSRVLLCLLSKECFNNPNVLRQLFLGNKEYLDRCEDDDFNLNANVKSIVFVSLDNNKGENKFETKTFDRWEVSDGFGFLVSALAKDQEFVESLRVGSAHNQDHTTVKSELLNKYHSKIRAILRNTLRYRSMPYLDEALFDNLLRRANLQGLSQTKPYEPPILRKANFPDGLQTSLDLKLENQFKKPKAAFFMPEKKAEHRFPHRVMILEAGGIREWVDESISEIAAAMQSYESYWQHADEKKYRVDKDAEYVTPFTKVLNSRKVKKMEASHLPAYPRITVLDKIRHAIFTEKKIQGRLIVVALVDDGFSKKYADLLEDFEAKRGAELHIIPVYLDMGGGSWKKEHEVLMKKLKSPELKRKFSKETFIPYFKKADNVEHVACMQRICKVAKALTDLKKPNEEEVLIVE